MSEQTYLRAMQEALGLLRARDRTRHEVEAGLLKKGHSKEDVDLVLKSLGELSYLNDHRVAARSVELAIRATKGALAVEQRLKARGTEPDAVESAIAEMPDQTELAEKAFWDKRKPGDTPARSAARLERQGFDEETVRTIIERHFPEFD